MLRTFRAEDKSKKEALDALEEKITARIDLAKQELREDIREIRAASPPSADQTSILKLLEVAMGKAGPRE